MAEIIKRIIWDQCEHCKKDVQAEVNDDLTQKEESRDVEWNCPECGKVNKLHIEGTK